MKKLNITKEQFSHSRYFTDKYGELEYVSESGKMFKTDKGKVLKFKESNDGLKDLIDDIFDDGLYEDGKKAQILLPQLETKLNDLGLLEDENVKDYFDEFADTIKICLKSSRIQNYYRDTAYKLADGLKYSIDSALGYEESTKKFGRKFKESKGLEWLNSFKQAQNFVDKACEQLEVVAFEGGAEVGNPIHKKLLRIWDEMRDVIGSI